MGADLSSAAQRQHGMGLEWAIGPCGGSSDWGEAEAPGKSGGKCSEWQLPTRALLPAVHLVQASAYPALVSSLQDEEMD